MQKNYFSATPIIVRCAIAGLLLGLTACSPTAQQNTAQQRIQLQAEASREVQNDQIEAVLYTESTASSAAQLNQQINQITAQSLALAGQYPNVQISSGNRYTQPIYSQRQKITGWNGRAEILLKSTDLEAASGLIAKLQEQLHLQSVGFTVSEKQRQAVQEALITEVSRTFQQRAKIAQEAWRASDFRMIEFNIQTQPNQPLQPLAYASDAAANASVEATQASLPIFAVGQSQVVVQAVGTIALK